MRILWVIVAALLLAAPTAESARTPSPRTAAARGSARTACDRYASPPGSAQVSALQSRRRDERGRPGSVGRPFVTLQRLVNALAPGQTGCLRGGTYVIGASELSFRRSGEPDAPITLRSAPGERATISGGPIYVPRGSDDIRIEQLNINTSSAHEVGVQIMSAHDALIGDRITNQAARTSCIILGSNGVWGQATATVLRNDVIHDCGSPADGNQDHAIYFDNSVNAVVSDSQIWGTAGFAIHLYANARGNVVRHNVIDDNRYGVIFADDAPYRSSGNIVADNVIADTTEGYGVTSWWNGPVGVDNVLARNCIYRAARGAIARPTVGFRAIGNVVAAPHFVDPARHRYGLLPGSGCLRTVGFDAARAPVHSARAGKANAARSSSGAGG